jgi:uncharacterized protein (DUF2252 family)
MPESPTREAFAVPAAASAPAGTPPKVTHLSRGERAAVGKQARSKAALDSHAEFSPADRSDPITLLESQAATRAPELVPIRYGRMVVSPFTFFRGAALVMAADLATTPTSGLQVQACGDAHLSNFGVYASPERRLIFDINDFDETYPGPFEWDVKRLAASLAVAARENGYPRKKRRAVLLATGRGYREAMRLHAGQGNLAVWYAHLDTDTVVQQIGQQFDQKRQARSQAMLAKFRTRDSLDAYAKLTKVVDGQARIVSQPPLIVPIEELWAEELRGEEQIAATYASLRALIRSYRSTLQSDRRHLLEEYKLVQMARKVVGVGSVGTRAWIVLFEGIDGGDPLFLQAKEAQTSVLSAFVKGRGFKNQGERVVRGQHLMQAASDIFLGWQRAVGPDGVERDFYVRQLRDGKGSVVVENMLPDEMAFYGRVCAGALARAHARSGDRVAIASYLGSSGRFDEAIADFAEAYADQNEKDHTALVDAIASGRVVAQTGI